MKSTQTLYKIRIISQNFRFSAFLIDHTIYEYYKDIYSHQLQYRPNYSNSYN